MVFNPVKIVEKTLTKIVRKKTTSFVKNNIEEKIMKQKNKEASENKIHSLSLAEADKIELCSHGYRLNTCPYCPPRYSVSLTDEVEELKHGWLVVLEGIQKGRYFPIYSQFETKIGTDSQCDIVLIGKDIAPFHSSIYYNPKIKKFMLKDLSPEPSHLTYVNDEQIPYEGEGVYLVDHMKIKFGDQVICRFKCILD